MIIVQLVIVFLIILLCCTSITFSELNRCPQDPKKGLTIRYVRAGKLLQLSSKTKIDDHVIRLRLDRDVPCGIYDMMTIYGDAILFVNHNDSRTGYMMIRNIDMFRENTKNINMLDLWDLERIQFTGPFDPKLREYGFIHTYNLGCCQTGK